MYRTHTCGQLRISDVGKTVTLAGWVQKARKMGGMTFIDLRDRYGITQLVASDSASHELNEAALSLGREYVIQATGTVAERSSKNPKMDTGDIEIVLSAIEILNKSEVPPFTIEDVSDGGEELRAKYRYLDLRRNPLKKALMLRHRIAHEVRNYLDEQGFLEIETPYLIKSTPEGARDFVVPSRMNPGQFYALPQSPQTFKQLLMVAGYDRYFQIVRCFRDEDLRADRQPEFTQIDCEMSFVEQEDVLVTFEGMMKRLFKAIHNIDIKEVPRMSWADAMDNYGSDKPDIRFGMTIKDVTSMMQGKGFQVFDSVQYVGGIAVPGCASYTRKQLDELMHHPFTAPKPAHLDKFYSNEKSDLEQVCADAYDFVLNGTELGGGSIRIHDAKVQARMFEILGFTKEDAEYKFGFIMNAFKYGAPPHGGLAFGFDRVCALFGGQETIRDYIAFPKNNQGRDVMIDAPSYIDDVQMDELMIKSTAPRESDR